MDFLQQDSNLLLLFSYLDPKSLITIAQACKHWYNLVHNDDKLWFVLAHRMGFEEYRLNNQSWKECVKDLYCPGGFLETPPLMYECTSCYRHLYTTMRKRWAVENQGTFPPIEEMAYVIRSKICRSSKLKQNDKKMCTNCNHLAAEHAFNLHYRETQFNRYLRAHDRNDYETMLISTSALVRLVNGSLKLQEQNIFSGSVNLYVNALRTQWKLQLQMKREYQQKDSIDQLALKIAQICRKTVSLIDDKLLPYVSLETLIRWVRLKIKLLDQLVEVSTLQAEKDQVQIWLRQSKGILEEISTNLELLDVPPTDPVILQLGLNYCEYCQSCLENPMRTYRIGKKLYDRAAAQIENEKKEKSFALLNDLGNLITNIEHSRVIHRIKAEKIVRQGYLRKRPSPLEEMTLPLWVVLGYWDNTLHIFVYQNMESEEALEIILLSDEVNTMINEDDSSEREFRILLNGDTMPSDTWAAVSKKDRDEWCFVLEFSKKTR